jgi:aryl-phospho-beta-D-glucosidase BglC (GH1 family)
VLYTRNARLELKWLVDFSQPGAVGQAQRDLASAIWSLVAQHYVGEPTIAAYDVMNEPTGSPGDILQIDMYNAIRPYDPDRIIIVSVAHRVWLASRG